MIGVARGAVSGMRGVDALSILTFDQLHELVLDEGVKWVQVERAVYEAIVGV